MFFECGGGGKCYKLNSPSFLKFLWEIVKYFVDRIVYVVEQLLKLLLSLFSGSVYFSIFSFVDAGFLGLEPWSVKPCIAIFNNSYVSN